MKQNLITANAFAIAYEMTRLNMCKHLNLGTYSKRIEITFFFDLGDERVDTTRKMIEQTAAYTPEYSQKIFDDSKFEILMIKWEFE